MDRKHVLAGIAASAVATQAFSAIVSYRDGVEIEVDSVGTGVIYNGTNDVELRQDDPDTNHDLGTGSADPEFTVDGDDPSGSGLDTAVLMRFDGIFGNGPGQVPIGSTINAATLFIDIDNTGNDLDLFRVTSAWGSESTETWNSFLAAGTFVDTGTDVNGGGDKVFIDVTAQVALWAAGTANNGWVFLPTGNDGIDFDASENSDPADRPQLVIDYTPVPEPGSLALIGLGGAAMLRRRR